MHLGPCGVIISCVSQTTGWSEHGNSSAVSPYLYPICLVVISACVALAEALAPMRPGQRRWRRWLWSDLVHLVFNGHFLGVIVFTVATVWVLPHLDPILSDLQVRDALYRSAAAELPVWAQIIAALFVIDFIHWCVHNLLHRVPMLWEFHKTHHSVGDDEMDFIVSFRFQWVEVVLYKTLQYFPLAFFGFGYEAVMTHAVFGTLIGHLNHSNIDVDYGPLRFVFNSPRMHIWHHDYEADGKSTVNFGVVFSCWDWIFGTAKLPDHPPKRIGFRGMDDHPRDFFGQVVWPLHRHLPEATPRWLASAIGGVIVCVALYIMLR